MSENNHKNPKGSEHEKTLSLIDKHFKKEIVDKSTEEIFQNFEDFKAEVQTLVHLVDEVESHFNRELESITAHEIKDYFLKDSRQVELEQLLGFFYSLEEQSGSHIIDHDSEK